MSHTLKSRNFPLIWFCLISLGFLARNVQADDALAKAVAFLKVEVPAWQRDNHCYSCHNNGDSARALYRASAKATLVETTRWLEAPQSWGKQGEDGPANDKKLARLQFALALATAIETGASAKRESLKIAADFVERDLAPDGSWPSFETSTVGSPVTYGPRLATALAICVFRGDGPERHVASIAKAETWLRAQPIANVVEAAAVLLIESRQKPTEIGQKARQFLLETQAKSGGWGPYRDTPTEAFDTALAMLALSPFKSESVVLKRARSALALMQNPDGSFPGSTRPPGGESYAQRLSTTGWATQALIEFDSRPR